MSFQEIMIPLVLRGASDWGLIFRVNDLPGLMGITNFLILFISPFSEIVPLRKRCTLVIATAKFAL